MRSTSSEVYRQIEAEGLLSKARMCVYGVLYRHGPLTQMEVCRKADSNYQDRSLTPRFAELEQMGVVQSIGERECTITGRNSTIWDVTSNLPKKLEKKPVTKMDELKAELAFLRKENAQLRKLIAKDQADDSLVISPTPPSMIGQLDLGLR